VLASAAVQPIEIDVNALLASERRQLDSVYALIAAALQNQKTPVVYTSRQELRFSTPGQRLQAGQTIASFLATLVQRLPFYPAYIIAKGGITSHEILVRGLQVATARVLGQILPGVPVIALPAQHRFGAIPYVIFPGNVGEPDALQNELNRLM
jgi:uncharacterized protein YgbK (DUF1537 family)